MGLLSMAFALYVVSFVIAWKLYDYFNMTLVDAATITGFQYHLKKLIFALFVPGIIFYFFGALYQSESNSKEAVTQSATLRPTTTSPIASKSTDDPQKEESQKDILLNADKSARPTEEGQKDEKE